MRQAQDVQQCELGCQHYTGTNQFIHCRTAIYLWDQHLNPYVRRWLGLGDDRFADDQYAITELVQWLYRTAVRRGEPITVYMPSKRIEDPAVLARRRGSRCLSGRSGRVPRGAFPRPVLCTRVMC